MERTVCVERVEGAYAWVSANRLSGCSGCAQKGGCGHALLSGGDTQQQLMVPNSLQARAGDWVVIAIPAHGVLAALAMAYGLPILGFILGAALGSLLGTPSAVIGGVAGLVAAFVVCRWVFARRQRHGVDTRLPHMVCRAASMPQGCAAR